MPEFKYAKGRVAESIPYLSEEIREFESEYADKTWKDYQDDKKLQKRYILSPGMMMLSSTKGSVK
jgi:hypothetical protein